MRKRVVWLIVVLAVAGCANPDGSTNTKGQSALEGGGAGALLGGIACAFAHCNAAGYAAAASIGAGAGALVGYSLADNIEKRRTALAGHENDLNARLTYVRGVNADTDAYNRQLRKDVADAEGKIDSGRLSARALEGQRKDLDAKIASSDKQLQSMEAALGDMKRYRVQRNPSSPQLDGEIARLETLLADARSNSTALASLRQRI